MSSAAHVPVVPTTYGFFEGMVKPDINPANHKSKTLVLFNPINKYGRTFHLAWLSFFVAFLSWFAFPPLLHGTINTNLKMTTAQVGNSNIVGLAATLIVRFIVGPLCDKYGPRYVMAGVLIAGAIPTACTPAITSVSGLYIVRFFVGILGGTFVPCMVWTTQFFDKPIVGRANALAGGWGNAGGGVTFFIMPAVVSSLMSNQHYKLGKAWRLAFPACPLAILIFVAVLVLVFGHDTPTGPWATRHIHGAGTAVDTYTLDRAFSNRDQKTHPMTGSSERSGSSSPRALKDEKHVVADPESDMAVGTITDELPENPKLMTTLKAIFHPQVLFLALTYLCSFGSELAIEGVLSGLYIQSAKLHDKKVWGQELAGQWAAMFGLLNVITRPLGGYISDKLYIHFNRSVAAKKWFLLALGLLQGIFFVWIGFKSDMKVHSLIGAMAGLAIFMEAANGANFSIVPHVMPKQNGVVSGMVGGSGNMGGIFFNLAFRFQGTNYHKAMWLIGFVIIAIQVVASFVPMPKH
ncbi:protein of unknown function [Taphrina deformans PYCC 5710]|uniref:Nitrate/nitrite transporter n=1 Tax=Taphrina deformans (strain PYCC 5710 / ATCC 11124 / CBS 356.35 / IMI 108563 / JCM 9778 / NBRC 8474) TaxID=1097556 RepID=R4XFH3_TAPDE|nr:protein of unknown function [Taphrina deformans PYCC 5710]|eukprot:CCG84626.1 protein of unknown function [Taphrina deformans PYCC 5710]